MKKQRTQEIAALIYENKETAQISRMAQKTIDGVSIETELEEISKKIGIPKDELKSFLKNCFSEFENLG